MRRLMDLGVAQGFLPPPLRPATAILRAVGFKGTDADVLRAAADEDLQLFRAACSASSMWTANAATVIAAADAADGRVHLVTANLATMIHRSMEAEDTYSVLRQVFMDERHLAVHRPLPVGRHFGDEGAANHMRLARSHGEPGLNIFVHGEERSGRFPERQARRASAAVARLGELPRDRLVFVRQSTAAVQAGAFHNDVVAVANEVVLLAHPEAFDDREAFLQVVRDRAPATEIVEVNGVSLPDAVSSYLFNSQLVTLPNGGMALVLPIEVRESATVWAALQRALARSSRIERLEIVDVRESMKNGGGPACLRLRVPIATDRIPAINRGYLLDAARLDRLVGLVERCWPEAIAPSDLTDPQLWEVSRNAHQALQSFITAD
jgi:succinylarginine dihydrolase